MFTIQILSTLSQQVKFTQQLELSECYKMESLIFNGFILLTQNLRLMFIQNQTPIQDQRQFKVKESTG